MLRDEIFKIANVEKRNHKIFCIVRFSYRGIVLIVKCPNSYREGFIELLISLLRNIRFLRNPTILTFPTKKDEKSCTQKGNRWKN
jgi:hypothetical protein